MFTFVKTKRYMEKNTVIIDLEIYNQLRDFKNDVLSGKVLVVKDTGLNKYRDQHFITSDEFLEIVHNANDLLIQENDRLKNGLHPTVEKLNDRIKELTNEVREIDLLLIKRDDNLVEKNNEIKKLKQMNIFQFLKFKYSK